MLKPELRAPIILPAVSLVLALIAFSPASAEQRFGFGETPTEEQIAGWNTDIRYDGQGLPEGSGSVQQGERLFEEQCIQCHGPQGNGKPMVPLKGGRGSLDTADPLKTVGSYWPYAPVIMDYVHRAMPMPQPNSLSTDELYALTAYILHINDVLPADAELDADTLRSIEMPNRDGFVPDPRPDVRNVPCMQDCRTE